MNETKLRQLAEFQASIVGVQKALNAMNECAGRFFDYLASDAGIDDTAGAIVGEKHPETVPGRGN